MPSQTPIATDYDGRQVFENVASAYVAMRAARLERGLILEPVRQAGGRGCYVTVRRPNRELVGFLARGEGDE